MDDLQMDPADLDREWSGMGDGLAEPTDGAHPRSEPSPHDDDRLSGYRSWERSM